MGYDRKSIKSSNLELEGICFALEKEGIVVQLPSVTYVTHVPDLMVYEYYCFDFPIKSPIHIINNLMQDIWLDYYLSQFHQMISTVFCFQNHHSN